jgi:hydrogenase maturation protein HypF
VQHHHAHIAAVMAEHGLTGSEQVLGFAFDGTGYGPDGAVWGGELLLADYKEYRRLGHLKYVPLAGGDTSIVRPYRMALAHLWAAGIPWDADLAPVQACPEDETRVLRHQLETASAAPRPPAWGGSSMPWPRWRVRQVVAYEAQAAIELEGLSRGPPPTTDAMPSASPPSAGDGDRRRSRAVGGDRRCAPECEPG